MMELENRMMMKIFGPKRDEERVGWTKWHSEECHAFTPHLVLFG
jgi:hypothetical protein